MRRGLRIGTASLVLALALFIPAASASAGVWDPNDTRGQLDIRWLNLKQAPHDRLTLTIGFWPGFSARALAGDYRHGLLVTFLLPTFDFITNGYTLWKDGHLKFRQGDFGSSVCCYGSRVRFIGPRTLTTTFLPWWIRTGEEENHGIDYRARTRFCRDPCIVDFTRHDLLP